MSILKKNWYWVGYYYGVVIPLITILFIIFFGLLFIVAVVAEVGGASGFGIGAWWALFLFILEILFWAFIGNICFLFLAMFADWLFNFWINLVTPGVNSLSQAGNDIITGVSSFFAGVRDGVGKVVDTVKEVASAWWQRIWGP